MEILRKANGTLGRVDPMTQGLDVAKDAIIELDSEGTKLRVLIVCPAENRSEWADFLEGTFSESDVREIGTHTADVESWTLMTAPDRINGMYITSWEALRGTVVPPIRTRATKVSTTEVRRAQKTGTVPPWRTTGVWDLVVLDGAEKIVSRNRLQAKVLREIRALHRVALSENPEGSSPQGLWSVLNWLWPREFPNFWSWAKENLNVAEKHIGHQNSPDTGGKVLRIDGEKKPGAIWESVYKVVQLGGPGDVRGPYTTGCSEQSDLRGRALRHL